mmetsp:Transcript_15151/g.33779  ORF Transcript_15151/g.33779 Transcript_15151/m.33779 type:complete len:259 (-) Transcript_15151:137-913(-)
MMREIPCQKPYVRLCACILEDELKVWKQLIDRYDTAKTIAAALDSSNQPTIAPKKDAAHHQPSSQASAPVEASIKSDDEEFSDDNGKYSELVELLEQPLATINSYLNSSDLLAVQQSESEQQNIFGHKEPAAFIKFLEDTIVYIRKRISRLKKICYQQAAAESNITITTGNHRRKSSNNEDKTEEEARRWPRKAPYVNKVCCFSIVGKKRRGYYQHTGEARRKKRIAVGGGGQGGLPSSTRTKAPEKKVRFEEETTAV